MKRRKFLRDCLMGIAVSLVPKILQPIVPELIEEVEITYGFQGLIPTIMNNSAFQVDYEQRNFRLTDLHELISKIN